MKIDLHVHTSIGSPCSILRIEDIIQRAKEINIDGVCITEHDNIKGLNLSLELRKKYNFLLLRGMEVRCVDGDVIIILEEPTSLPLHNITISKLSNIVHEKGGIIYPVHPFRYGVPSINEKIYQITSLDALEILNGNCDEEENKKALMASKKLNLLGLGGSDAHNKAMLGKYVTIFKKKINNEKELIRAIKERDGQAVQLF
jgi:hypothetical protein